MDKDTEIPSASFLKSLCNCVFKISNLWFWAENIIMKDMSVYKKSTHTYEWEDDETLDDSS